VLHDWALGAPLPATAATLHEGFREWARRAPDRVALTARRETLSYGELDRRSAALAARLRSLGVDAETRVGVCLERTPRLVVALLAVLRAGGAYVPLDPAYPRERIDLMVEDSGCRVLLTEGALRGRLPAATTGAGPELVALDEETATQGDAPAKEEWAGGSEELAYVIYTSGSTGAPKGVAIEHQAVVNTVLDINRRFRVSHEDRVLAVSALGFDLSVYDIFGILSAGGKVVLPDSVEGKDAAHWCDLVDRENITLWNSVPALLQMLIDYLEGSGRGVDAAPRLILLSGDWVPLSLPERIRSLWKNPQVISLGGATEASIWSIYYPIDTISSEWHSVPYGKPLANQCFFVLNDRLDSCPDWVPGQLYIGGMGLARGYWRDDENTRQSFIAHPVTNERLYRTGDMGRYLPDGNIEFLGRADYQVKIKGYRIELGEIEATLRANPRVKDAVVSAVGEPHGDKRLVAYVVLNQTYRGFPVGGVGSGAGDDKEIASIRQFLADRLPIYMVPGTFMLLDRIPLTRNGKVDRKTLPEPTSVRGDVAASAMPRNGDEAKMAQLFASTLKLKSVGIHDSFFELGGDSLLATRLVANTGRTFGIELHLRDLFKGPSVAEFAARVAELKRSPVRQTARSGPDAAAQEEEGDL
jgi:amino acid adenylation domain-containing protein